LLDGYAAAVSLVGRDCDKVCRKGAAGASKRRPLFQGIPRPARELGPRASFEAPRRENAPAPIMLNGSDACSRRRPPPWALLRYLGGDSSPGVSLR
jgi:hypothetical protein